MLVLHLQNVFLNAYVLGTITILIGALLTSCSCNLLTCNVLRVLQSCFTCKTYHYAIGMLPRAVKHDQKLGTYRERIDNCRQYSAINNVPPVRPNTAHEKFEQLLRGSSFC